MQIGPIRLSVLMALLIGVGSAWAQDQGGKSAPRATARVGGAAPDFTLLDCNGRKHTLSGHKDQIVVLEWLNQQCPVSLGAVPVMKDLRKKYAGKNIVWLGIESTYYRKPEENLQYAKAKELDFPILMDNDGKVGRMYGAKVTPHIFVVSQGKLVYAGALRSKPAEGKPETESRNYLDETLQALLAAKAVPVAETTPWGCSVKYKPAGDDQKDNKPRDDRK
jgi:peroxiredoxin